MDEKNRLAVDKRKREIKAEKLDSEIAYIYMQKDEKSSRLQTTFKSGRTVSETTLYNAN